ncbi:hypothetical protein OLX02_08685 [Novosphingobium sp. KCTC 2891]|uniref:hypothetical protein n=1 Tax=Novosphingobium sp. KCTC 2891 TaxID=2989730 RepID=UPI0022218414|nr:hypothetical protein [Novosphingobium sp. KCTC 2891]MCW1382898.1 hypothetical protein [Novosphingobium sp. KCTC 2891]
MINLRESSARVVAGDAREMGGMIDRALLQQMRLATSFIEVTQESKLAMPLTQAAIQAMTEGLNCLVEGRAKIAGSVREMTRILSASNLKEVSFGCPDGLWKASVETPAVVAAA